MSARRSTRRKGHVPVMLLRPKHMPETTHTTSAEDIVSEVNAANTLKTIKNFKPAARPRGRPPRRSTRLAASAKSADRPRRNAQDECLCAMCWCECKKCKLRVLAPGRCDAEHYCKSCAMRYCGANPKAFLTADGKCLACHEIATLVGA